MASTSTFAACLAAMVAAGAIWFALLSSAGRPDDSVSDSPASGVATASPTSGGGAAGNREKARPVAVASASDADYPRLPAVPRAKGAPVWSPEELKPHDGTDLSIPLLLSIVGEVYDVATGAKHYAPGKGYAGFAGNDVSRSFATGLGEGDRTSKISDLDPEEVHGVLGWRGFYRDHETYRFVGFLEGIYFDKDGTPTEEGARVDVMHEDQNIVDKMRTDLKKRFLGCNTKHEQNKPLFEIWCDDGYHGQKSKPLHVYFKPPGDAKQEDWCACLMPAARKLAKAEIAQPRPGQPTFWLKSYPECKKGAQKCYRDKKALPP